MAAVSAAATEAASAEELEEESVAALAEAMEAASAAVLAEVMEAVPVAVSPLATALLASLVHTKILSYLGGVVGAW